MEEAQDSTEYQNAETFAKDEVLAAEDSAIKETKAILLSLDSILDSRLEGTKRQDEIHPSWTHDSCDRVEESTSDDLACFERINQCLSSAVLSCSKTFAPEILFTITKLRDEVVGDELNNAGSQLYSIDALMNGYLKNFAFEVAQSRAMFEKQQKSHSKAILKGIKRINLQFDTVRMYTETGIKLWKTCVQTRKECSLEIAEMISALSKRQAEKQHVLLAEVQLQQKAEIIEMKEFFEMFATTYDKMESIVERIFGNVQVTAERLAFNAHKALFKHKKHLLTQMDYFENNCSFYTCLSELYAEDAWEYIDKVLQGLVRLEENLASAIEESERIVKKLKVNSLKVHQLSIKAVIIILETLKKDLANEKNKVVKPKRVKYSVLPRLKSTTKIVKLLVERTEKKYEVAHEVLFILNKLLDDVVRKKLKMMRLDLYNIDEMISSYIKNVSSFANNSITMFEEKERRNSGVLFEKFERISLDFDYLLTDCAEGIEHWKACVQSRKEYSLKMTENILALSKLQDEIAKLQDTLQKVHLEQKEKTDQKLQDRLQKMQLEHKAKIDEISTFSEMFTTLHGRMEQTVKSDFENVQLKVQNLLLIVDEVFSMQKEHQTIQVGFHRFFCACLVQTGQCLKDITPSICKVFRSLIDVVQNVISEANKIERIVEELRVDSSNIYESNLNALSSALNICKKTILDAKREVVQPTCWVQRKIEDEKEIETDV